MQSDKKGTKEVNYLSICEKKEHLVDHGEKAQKSEWNWRFGVKFRRLIISSCGDEST